MCGYNVARLSLWLVFGVSSLALGCANGEVETPAQASVDDAPLLSTDFDPKTAVTIQGRVRWHGDIPTVPAFERLSNLPAGDNSRANPNAPRIDPKTKAVNNAVVFLRGVDASKAKPWHLPPVRVEQRGRRLHVLQGDADSHFGFVRRGDAVTMVSKENVFHSLHAAGAAYFTLAFPDPDQPLVRRLSEKGIIELTSAAGYYWMRAYLFVDDHSYFARTDEQGRFEFALVPPGRYDVVCWMPNWNESRHERDPEIGVIRRWYYKKPCERVQSHVVTPGAAQAVDISLSAQSFDKQ